MASTIAPSGLSVARDGMNFTLSWKITDTDYGNGQEFQYRTNLDESGKWTDVDLGVGGTSVTSRTITLSASNYYPTTSDTLLRIAFRVRGKRSPSTDSGTTTYYDWSAWASIVYGMDVPLRPTLTSELSETYDNQTTFTWDTAHSSSDKRPALNVEWQMILVHNSTETDGSALRWSSNAEGWVTGTGTLTDSVTKTEDTVLTEEGSYTRWVRVRSRGTAGASEWRYAKHVYARPYKADITDVNSGEGAETTSVKVEWTTQVNAAHPVDTTTVQWAIETPEAGLSCPSGASWTDATTVSDNSGKAAVRFVVDNQVGIDEALFVRIVTTHDRYEQATPAELVRVGRLATPSDLSIANVDSTNYQVDITCTNNSDVPDSKLAVIFRGDGKRALVGVINVHGGTSGTITDLQCPKWNDATLIGFTVYAFQGTYSTGTKTAGGVTYNVITTTENATSPAIGSNASIPLAPASVSVTVGKLLTDAIVHWSWTWNAADQAEISWSSSPWAWNSTEQPNTFIVEDSNATKWRVRGLTPGQTYYFRVRLGKTGDETVWSPYSDTIEAGLYSAPDTPALQLSAASVKPGGKFVASWTYASADGVAQERAEVCAYVVSALDPVESRWPNLVIARTSGAQAVNVKAADGRGDWVEGKAYRLRVRVFSKSGAASAWSSPVDVTVPTAISIDTVTNSLVSETITDSSGISRTVLSLKSTPFTVTATPGAPTGGTTTAIIERDEDYRMDRPDGSLWNGYEGEVVAIKRVSGAGQISIRKKDLIGSLDDGAKYRLRVVAESDPSEPAQVIIPFEVHWSTQAQKPTASVIEYLADNAIKITPTTSSLQNNPTCDIYRLSADKPELIVRDGTFGTAYVDPYPAIGGTAGYRVVFKTVMGDYITSSNKPGWRDEKAGLSLDKNIIDFNGEQIMLSLNMSVSHSWVKNFTETEYLGGAIQGDWTLGVKRTTSISATAVTVKDQSMIDALRRLALWSGICHVRTVDGSSFAADIQVSETRSYQTAGNAAVFDLKITRIDPERLDGVTYGEWLG